MTILDSIGGVSVLSVCLVSVWGIVRSVQELGDRCISPLCTDRQVFSFVGHFLLSLLTTGTPRLSFVETQSDAWGYSFCAVEGV